MFSRLSKLAAQWRRIGLGLVFPPRCAHCDAELEEPADGIVLCGPCRESLSPPGWSYCRRCGGIASPAYPQLDRCEWCRNTRLHFDTVVSLGPYHGELKSAVLRMKRPDGEVLAETMGILYYHDRLNDVLALNPELVVPVPMHWARRLHRATNSAELLAAALSGRLRLRYNPRALIRCRNTLPQRDLPPMKRFQNVRGAFRLHHAARVKAARVLLVDDILTTGATCSEAAKVLKDAGAAMVAVAVLARAEGDQFA